MAMFQTEILYIPSVLTAPSTVIFPLLCSLFFLFSLVSCGSKRKYRRDGDQFEKHTKKRRGKSRMLTSDSRMERDGEEDETTSLLSKTETKTDGKTPLVEPSQRVSFHARSESEMTDQSCCKTTVTTAEVVKATENIKTKAPPPSARTPQTPKTPTTTKTARTLKTVKNTEIEKNRPASAPAEKMKTEKGKIKRGIPGTVSKTQISTSSNVDKMGTEPSTATVGHTVTSTAGGSVMGTVALDRTQHMVVNGNSFLQTISSSNADCKDTTCHTSNYSEEDDIASNVIESKDLKRKPALTPATPQPKLLPPTRKMDKTQESNSPNPKKSEGGKKAGTTKKKTLSVDKTMDESIQSSKYF